MQLTGSGSGFALPKDRARAEKRPANTGQHDHGTCLPEIFFPELAEWRTVLHRLALTDHEALDIAVRAREQQRSFQSMLVASGLLAAADISRAIAEDLGLEFVETIDPERLVISEGHAATLLRGRNGQVPAKLLEGNGLVSFLITSEAIDLARMRNWIAAHPALTDRLRMADPDQLRAAILSNARPTLLRKAVNGLFERFPDMSARVVANAWQGAILGAILALLPVGLVFAPDILLELLHIVATFFFFLCVALRFAVIASTKPDRPQRRIPMPTGKVPVYAVLVALYKEADIIPDLLAALDRIVWPRDRLEIKLVCEADDLATLAMLNSRKLPRHIEVVEVPAAQPRTKPKALAYALALTNAEYVALYDAEDWPDPMQLAEAWQRFSAAGPELAVLQAPLEISNGRAGPLARMFAFEYAGLFRALLPWLSRSGLALPLGGTSNHFRMAALEAVGGWDPFNVTEDADLGMRLARFGFRAETISRPTYEAAPTRFSVWLPQRTRWFKGWGQSWLVHMRSPWRLLSELGLKSFVVLQALLAGMLVSALLHPLLLATFITIALRTLLEQPSGPLHSLLFAIDTANIVCGYLSFLLLGWQTLSKDERRGFWFTVLLTPFYWALLSFAGWRAIWQLWREPHHWEKTPHEAVKTTR
jgi:cellulose synthase/poly-beta-1,6-N-acetylglucosamine synthase-like glycosyltransferase